MKKEDVEVVKSLGQGINFTTKETKHRCVILKRYEEGQIQNISQNPLFRFKVSEVEDFVGRRIDMQETLESLRTHRLVTIKGMPGIGKSSLAKTVGRYIDERAIFKAGIIWVSGRDKNSNQIISEIALQVSKY